MPRLPRMVSEPLTSNTPDPLVISITAVVLLFGLVPMIRVSLTVIVCAPIETVSPAPGTPAPPHVAALFQSPVCDEVKRAIVLCRQILSPQENSCDRARVWPLCAAARQRCAHSKGARAAHAPKPVKGAYVLDRDRVFLFAFDH